MNAKSSSDEGYSLDFQLDMPEGDYLSDGEMPEYLNPVFSTESDTTSEYNIEEDTQPTVESAEEVKLDPKIKDQYVSLKNEICNCVPKCDCEMTSQITYL